MTKTRICNTKNTRYSPAGCYRFREGFYLEKLRTEVHISPISYQQKSMDLNQYLNPETLAILQTGGYFLMLGLMIVE